MSMIKPVPGPSEHPSSFYLNVYLVSLEPETFGFLLDLCPNVLPVSHGDLDASSSFFNYIYIVVINFLKLLSDMYVGPSPTQS